MHKSRGRKGEPCLVIMGLDSQTNLEVLQTIPSSRPRSTSIPSSIAPQPIVIGDTGPVHLFVQVE